MTETRTTLKIVTFIRTTPEAGRTYLPLTDGARIRPKPKLLDQLCETFLYDNDLHSPAQLYHKYDNIGLYITMWQRT